MLFPYYQEGHPPSSDPRKVYPAEVMNPSDPTLLPNDPKIVAPENTPYAFNHSLIGSPVLGGIGEAVGDYQQQCKRFYFATYDDFKDAYITMLLNGRKCWHALHYGDKQYNKWILTTRCAPRGSSTMHTLYVNTTHENRGLRLARLHREAVE